MRVRVRVRVCSAFACACACACGVYAYVCVCVRVCGMCEYVRARACVVRACVSVSSNTCLILIFVRLWNSPIRGSGPHTMSTIDCYRHLQNNDICAVILCYLYMWQHLIVHFVNLIPRNCMFYKQDILDIAHM